MMKRFKSRPLFLCGMMGSGKSTIGHLLASMLSISFYDLDEVIEKEAGMSIPEIFEMMGEDAFREMERKQLHQISNKTNCVVSLGGGALQNREITDQLKTKGVLIFLDCDEQILFNRLKNSTHRPMLTAQGQNELQSKIHTLLEQRLPLYRRAHLTINSGNQTAEETAKELIQTLTQYEKNHSG